MKNNKVKYSVEMMSNVLKVSPSGYYKWLKFINMRQDAVASIKKEIANIYKISHKTYGSPRITIELQKKCIKISKATTSRLMKDMKLVARAKKRFTTTTDSNHNFVIPDNLLGRKFEVEHPNTVWVSDITYVRVNNKWMYLTIMLDLADRMIVGWTLSDNMTARDTVINAFDKAIQNRRISKHNSIMVHSDRGVQYACNEFRDLLKKYNCVQSMSRRGNCWDNAVAESFFKTIKTESLDQHNFKSPEVLKSVIFRYIDGWYNTIRIHSHLNGKAPLDAYYQKSINFAA